MDTETGEMIVKRVSVPIGLEELMEGLVKEVLLKKPDDIYVFAARYFAHLLTIRDKVPVNRTKTVRTVQTLKEKPSKPVTHSTSKLSKQFSIREDSPTPLESPIISQKPKMYQRNELKNNRRRHTGPTTVLPNNQQVTIRRKYAKSVSGEIQKPVLMPNNNGSKSSIQTKKIRSDDSFEKSSKFKNENNNNKLPVLTENKSIKENNNNEVQTKLSEDVEKDLPVIAGNDTKELESKSVNLVKTENVEKDNNNQGEFENKSIENEKSIAQAENTDNIIGKLIIDNNSKEGNNIEKVEDKSNDNIAQDEKQTNKSANDLIDKYETVHSEVFHKAPPLISSKTTDDDEISRVLLSSISNTENEPTSSTAEVNEIKNDLHTSNPGLEAKVKANEIGENEINKGKDKLERQMPSAPSIKSETKEAETKEIEGAISDDSLEYIEDINLSSKEQKPIASEETVEKTQNLLVNKESYKANEKVVGENNRTEDIQDRILESTEKCSGVKKKIKNDAKSEELPKINEKPEEITNEITQNLLIYDDSNKENKTVVSEDNRSEDIQDRKLESTEKCSGVKEEIKNDTKSEELPKMNERSQEITAGKIQNLLVNYDSNKENEKIVSENNRSENIQNRKLESTEKNTGVKEEIKNNAKSEELPKINERSKEIPAEKTQNLLVNDDCNKENEKIVSENNRTEDIKDRKLENTEKSSGVKEEIKDDAKSEELPKINERSQEIPAGKIQNLLVNYDSNKENEKFVSENNRSEDIQYRKLESTEKNTGVKDEIKNDPKSEELTKINVISEDIPNVNNENEPVKSDQLTNKILELERESGITKLSSIKHDTTNLYYEKENKNLDRIDSKIDKTNLDNLEKEKPETESFNNIISTTLDNQKDISGVEKNKSETIIKEKLVEDFVKDNIVRDNQKDIANLKTDCDIKQTEDVKLNSKKDMIQENILTTDSSIGIKTYNMESNKDKEITSETEVDKKVSADILQSTEREYRNTELVTVQSNNIKKEVESPSSLKDKEIIIESDNSKSNIVKELNVRESLTSNEMLDHEESEEDRKDIQKSDYSNSNKSFKNEKPHLREERENNLSNQKNLEKMLTFDVIDSVEKSKMKTDSRYKENEKSIRSNLQKTITVDIADLENKIVTKSYSKENSNVDEEKNYVTNKKNNDDLEQITKTDIKPIEKTFEVKSLVTENSKEYKEAEEPKKSLEKDTDEEINETENKQNISGVNKNIQSGENNNYQKPTPDILNNLCEDIKTPNKCDPKVDEIIKNENVETKKSVSIVEASEIKSKIGTENPNDTMIEESNVSKFNDITSNLIETKINEVIENSDKKTILYNPKKSNILEVNSNQSNHQEEEKIEDHMNKTEEPIKFSDSKQINTEIQDKLIDNEIRDSTGISITRSYSEDIDSEKTKTNSDRNKRSISEESQNNIEENVVIMDGMDEETDNSKSKSISENNLVERVAKNYVNYVIDNNLSTENDVSATDDADIETIDNETENNTESKSDELPIDNSDNSNTNTSDRSKRSLETEEVSEITGENLKDKVEEDTKTSKNNEKVKKPNITKQVAIDATQTEVLDEDSNRKQLIINIAENLVTSTLEIAQTGLIEHKVKNFLNDFIDREKNNGDQNENKKEITEKLIEKSTVSLQGNPNSKSFDTTSHSQPPNGLKKASSFDSSKLREELKKVEEESKFTNFKNTFNPFVLRKEIDETVEHKSSKEPLLTSMNFRKVVDAVTVIQRTWRKFQKRKKNNKINDTKPISAVAITKKFNSIDTNSKKLTAANEDFLTAVNAVLMIQRIWRGYKSRKNLKVIKNGCKVANKRNADFSAAFRAALIIQRIWRGYKTRKYLKDTKNSKDALEKNSVENLTISDKEKEEKLNISSENSDKKHTQERKNEKKITLKTTTTKSKIMDSNSTETEDSDSKTNKDRRIFSAESTDSVKTVVLNDHYSVNHLLDEILDYPTVEEEYMLDNYQSKLLEKISGKEDDNEFDDIKALEKIISPKRIEDIDLQQLKDEVHISLVPKTTQIEKIGDRKLTRVLSTKLDILEEENSNTEEEEADKENITADKKNTSETSNKEIIYTFCSEPTPILCDSKLIDDKPLSEHVEIVSTNNKIDKNNKLEEAKSITNSKPKKESQTSAKNHKTTHKDPTSFYTGELHETLVIPLPAEVKKRLKNNEVEGSTDQESIGSDKVTNLSEISSMLSNAGIDGGDLHDTVAVPVNERSVDTSRSQPISVQLCQSPGQVYLIIILPPLVAGFGLDAENLMTSPDPPMDVTGSRASCDAQDPGKADLRVGPASESAAGSVSSPESMESEKRRKTDGVNMEAQAATKIQAGFRGYQVRKQLKLKNGSSDVEPPKKSTRSKTSGIESVKNQSPKIEEIEEQSAVKIQAGIRGFLVRRRQKKHSSQQA